MFLTYKYKGMSVYFCPLRVLKLSKKQRKRIFVNRSKTPYFRTFLQIPRTCKKLIEIFNSHTGHHFLRQPFEVSVTFSADSEIGSVQANIAYDDSVIEFVSSDNASGGGGVLTVNGFPDTPSSEVDFSFTFKGLSAGNANISLQSCQIYSPDSELIGSPTAYCVITVGSDR